MPVQGRWQGYRFMDKLRALNAQLRWWNRDVFGDIQIKKKEVVARIHEIDALELEGPLDSALKEERVSSKGDLAEMIRKENVSWSQKSKIKWTKEGDCNNSFFHRAANDRRNKNHLGLLLLDNGKSTRDGMEIDEEIIRSFSNFYSSKVWDKPLLEGIDWSPILTREDGDLVVSFTLDELKKVVFNCDENKFSGVDGFSVTFFIYNWNLIKGDLEGVFKEFFEGGILNSLLV